MSDELMQLWQESARPEPDRSEIRRLAGRAAMSRFDRVIRARNLREYAAGALMVGFFSWRLAAGDDVAQNLIYIAAVVFVVVFLWVRHRNQVPLDPAATAHDYQVAMLRRIDDQIRLLSSMRYWYLLPLYIPLVWTAVVASRRSLLGAGVFLGLATAIYIALAWLNESVAVRHLVRERAKIEALFEDAEQS